MAFHKLGSRNGGESNELVDQAGFTVRPKALKPCWWQRRPRVMLAAKTRSTENKREDERMMKRLLIGGGIAGALVLAFLLGSLTLGLVLAAPPSPTTTPQATVDNGSNGQKSDPAYTGSITVPANQANDANEQAEADALKALAKISADQAKQAALDANKGATVSKVGLDDENGFLVYSVQLKDASGKAMDVKVDAGNGKILASEADGPEGTEHNGSADKEGAED
jgi:hypothetical protein